MYRFFSILLFGFTVATSLAQTPTIIKSIFEDPTSPYYFDFSKYPKIKAQMPIGVFDSGTGGLTVLNAILNLDSYNNITHKKGADGILDFQYEDFIYLADQANMPYGNYAATNKTDLLREHIVKDAHFLLQDSFYVNQMKLNSKSAIKTMVVACNTATAYGLSDIEHFLSLTKTKVKVIGVINAGVEGAMHTFAKNENGSIGIFATAGTVASNGYTNAIHNYIKANGYKGDIQLYSQGGVGVAEAIDEDLNYIDPNATSPRNIYKGPSLVNKDLFIDKTLLSIYGFDFSNFKMLCDAKQVDQCSLLQINSPENYVRYHLVSLLEQMRANPKALPLKTLILGCTHYPFLIKEIEKVLVELRSVKMEGRYLYKNLIAPKVHLIDPSVNTAEALYEYLTQHKLTYSEKRTQQAEFFISIPNTNNPTVVTDNDGSRFVYDYKYGREAGTNQEYILNVPFSKQNINDDIIKRFQKQIPSVFNLLVASPLNRWVGEMYTVKGKN